MAFSCEWARNGRHAPFGASTVGQYRELPGTVKAGQFARDPRIPPDSYAPLSGNTLWLRQAIADVYPSVSDSAPEIDEGETGDRGTVPPGRVEPGTWRARSVARGARSSPRARRRIRDRALLLAVRE